MVFVGSKSPLSVSSVPPVIVVEPLTPDAEAVQVLWSWLAVNTSFLEVLTLLIVAVLVTEPLGPMVPCVLTSIWPLVKIVAMPPGPACTLPDAAVALCGLFEASGASVTTGVGPESVVVPNDRMFAL
jgi:hypothetical protein